MRKRKNDTVFIGISVIAAVLVLIELVLKSFGKSLCSYEGCKMTAQYARFGEPSILLIGLLTFSALAIFTLLNLTAQKPLLERIVNLILVTALASEGFFMGYLAFRVHTICLICLTTFCFIVLLAIVRLLAGDREVLAGFAALVAVFLLQYLILPAGISLRLPDDRNILFYSKDCKHCSEVISEFENKKVPVRHLEVIGYASYLQSMGIDSVPTLLVNDKYQKVFLTGREAIVRYLLSCTTPEAQVSKTVLNKKSGTAAGPIPNTAATFDIFNPPSLLSAPGSSLEDAGMCKQEEICK